METNPKKQRQHFYRDYASGQWSMSELCDRYQISRPTGYKWIDRLETEGLKAVDDRSRAPNRHPNRTPEHVERWEIEQLQHGGKQIHALSRAPYLDARCDPTRPYDDQGNANHDATDPSTRAACAKR